MPSNGFILIHKPTGPTSFDIVAKARRACHEKSVGHCGTLDPDASGLLVIALGNCTRLINYLPLEPKTYRFNIRFGSETNTADASGTITETTDTYPTEQELRNILPSFTGTIQQRPPAYSAIKINGERAYKLARDGKDVEMPERPVTISALSLITYDPSNHTALCEATVSAGTYIRSLAVDIAKALGSLAHAQGIHRTQTGIFKLTDATSLEQLALDPSSHILSPETVFSQLPIVTVSKEIEAKISHGINFPAESDEPTLFIFTQENRFLAVAQKTENRLYHPQRVFHADC